MVGEGPGLFQAVLAVASDLDLSTVLRRIIVSARELTGCRYAALGVIGGDGDLDEFVHTGFDDDTVSAVGALPRGAGILGLLIAQPTTIRLQDLGHHPDAAGFPEHHPEMKSFLGVPIKGRDTIFGNLYLTEKIGADDFTEDDEHMVEALAAAAAVAVENARMYAETRQREQRLDAIREITTTMLAGAEATEVLKLVCHHARSLVGAEVAYAILVDETDPDGLLIAASDGANAENLRGMRMSISGSLSGQVVATGQTAITGDIEQEDSADAIAAKAGGMQRALLVPLESANGRIGCLALGRSPGAARFRPEDLELAEAFAAQAALVIEFSRSQRQLEQLAVVEDRERIARDLHDQIVQSLFSTGIKLQSLERQIDKPEAAARVQQAVDNLDRTIRDIRSAIFALESVRAGDNAVRADLLAVTERCAEALGFPPRVRLEGGIDGLPDDLARDLLAVVEEALSNVAKHARASQVDLEVCVDSCVVMRVIDNGVGLDAAAPSSDGGNGLRNLEARARRWGGTFTARPTSEQGTVVEWQVPLPS